MSKIQLTQQFKAKIGSGDAREITFLANSGKEMANGESIDLDTLTVRDPDTGAQVLVSELKPTERKNYAPLLVDHNWSVEKKAGEVRALWLSEAGLMASATLAHTEQGERLLTLAKDDMLDTFSVTVGYEEEDGGVIKNAQLLEISAVWLGNDETTRLESLNERRANMATSSNNLTKDEATDLLKRLDELKEAVGALADEETPAEDDGEETPRNQDGDDVTPVKPSENAKTINNFISVQKNEREAKCERKTSVNQVSVKSNGKGYLDSKQAVKDFARVIVANRGRGDRATMQAWNENLKSYAINGDILPTSIEQVFFKTWTDADSVLSTFRNTTARQLDLYAFTPASDEGGRAKGHKKGEEKQDQELNVITRTTRVKGIYKKLPLDLQDLVDDTSGELLTFRAEELAGRVANEIVRSAILGDGRTAATPDLRTFDGTRGLWSIEADIEDSTTAGTYGEAVATKLTETAGDTLYNTYMRVLGAVRTTGRKVLIVPFGAITQLLTAKDAESRPLFYPGTTPEQIFPNTRVFELDEMVQSDGNYAGKYMAIAYAENSYVLNGENNGRVITDFDITKNQDVMEVVRYTAGSLNGRKVAAGIVGATA